MPNQIIGKILFIYPTDIIRGKDGRDFTKRKIVLDTSRYDSYTGEKFENTPMLEFIGDRCSELDNYQIGQIVTISFDVQGTRYRNKDNVEQIFTRVQPYRIEARQTQQPSAPIQQPTSQPIAQPTPQPITQQQPQSFPPAQGNNDDLPF